MYFFLSLNKCERFCILLIGYLLFFLSPSFRVISCVSQCDVLFSCVFFFVFICLCCDLRQFGSVEPAVWFRSLFYLIELN